MNSLKPIVSSSALRAGLGQAVRVLSQKSGSGDKGARDQKPAAAGKDGAKPLWHYTAKDYHGYDMYSYFDIETDMVKYRVAQPSSLPETVNTQTTRK